MTGPRSRQIRRGNNRGVALITAMLITALASIVAADLAWDNALDVRRTMALLARDQAVQVALGAESWIIGILHQDFADSETDHLAEIWATELPGLPIDGGEVFGALEDMQGRFNVNNLIDQNGGVHNDSLVQFQRLLTALDLDPRLAGIVVDWLDEDINTSFPDGAEDPIYTGMTPPYRAGNQLLTSTSELAAIDGMNKLTFDTLAPHIAALPGRRNVNVNTATPAVPMSLGDDISASDVESLLSEREAGGFSDIQAAFATLADPVLMPTLDETTEYFQLKLVVRIGTVRITYYSLLYRGPGGDVTPIVRSLGTT